MISFSNNLSPSRSPPPALQIWNSRNQNPHNLKPPQKSFLPPSSATSIGDGPCCRICRPVGHPLTISNSFLPPLLACLLNNKLEASSLSTSSHPQWVRRTPTVTNHNPKYLTPHQTCTDQWTPRTYRSLHDPTTCHRASLWQTRLWRNYRRKTNSKE